MHGDAGPGTDTGFFDDGAIATTMPLPMPGTSDGSDPNPTSTTTTGSIDSTTDDPLGSSDGGPMLPDGSQCAEDDDCRSGQCDLAGPLGGVCGECNEDADCVGGGCSSANHLTSEPSYCNDGTAGEGCETSDVCVPGLVCGVVLDIPGLLTTTTCGECLVDADCGPGSTCQPDYDISSLGGHWRCVPVNSLDIGAGCDLDNGELACASGFCEAANYMDLFDVGVCSECSSVDDCPPMTAECLGPEVDLAEDLTPGVCE